MLLCSQWQRTGAWLIAGGLYPGYHWIGSRLNRGDAPSRFEEVAGPGRPVPSRYERASVGDFSQWDQLWSVGPVKRYFGNWITFSLLSTRLVSEW